MKNKHTQLTTAQFAKLHEVNKRTLHYYDNIGLFSPKNKGKNGYRYYDSSQSVDFEYIRMLKDLDMSIEELDAYMNCPNAEKFIEIAEKKERELDAKIKHLKRTKQILQQKKEQVNFCKKLYAQEIRIQEFKEEKLLVLPFDFDNDDLSNLFSVAKNNWSIEQIRMGVGGYISLDKVVNNDFEIYDGIFSPVLKNQQYSKFVIKPKGKYLCGYQKGIWDKLPMMYQKMFTYAKENDIELTGYAYEIGLNEFVISSPEDYITQIMIKIKEND